ncbi:hypothetical protein AAG570_007006 [Ranatra chinensis]|uniref:BTB domain-containing protein n=1 Tax=Ranatra chinensis TaxID=642074 RepID=A0ABD0YXV8_9HEMI
MRVSSLVIRLTRRFSDAGVTGMRLELVQGCAARSKVKPLLRSGGLYHSSDSIKESRKSSKDSESGQNKEVLPTVLDNDDSFDLFIPNRFMKLGTKSTDSLKECDENSGLLRSHEMGTATSFETGSSFYTEVINNYKHPPKSGMKLCPICLSHFSKLQLHLKSCSKKHGLSSKQLDFAQTLQDKYSLEREQMGLPPLNSLLTKIKLNKVQDPEYHEEETSALIFEERNVEIKKPLTGKSKKNFGNPLLLRRTEEEREKIVTEKVAIVLMNSKNYTDFVEMPGLLSSEHLANRRNQDSYLWKISSLPPELSRLKDFYVEPLFPLIEPIQSIQNAFEYNQKVKDPVKTDTECTSEISPKNDPQRSSQLYSCLPKSPPYPFNYTFDEFPLSQKYYEKNFTHYDEKANEENCKSESPSDVDPLKKLSLDWDELLNQPELSDVTVTLSKGSTMCVHSLVLAARSPTIIRDVVNDRGYGIKLLKWPQVSFSACFTFFRYIYSGMTCQFESLSDDDVALVKELSRQYGIEELNSYIENNPSSKAPLQIYMEKQPIGCINRADRRFLCSPSSSPEIKRKHSNSFSSEELELNEGLENKKIKLFNSKSFVTHNDTSEINSDNAPKGDYNNTICRLSFESCSLISKKNNLCKDCVTEKKEMLKTADQTGNWELDFEQSKKDLSRNAEHATKDNEICSYEIFSPSPVESEEITSSLVSPVLKNSVNSNKVDLISEVTTSNQLTVSRQMKQATFSLEKYFFDDSLPSGADNLTNEIESISSLKPVDNKSMADSENVLSIEDVRERASTPSTPPEIIILQDVTPMPDYNTMASPELKNELRKYGLKPGLPRNKAKLLLQYIYDQIHPVIDLGKANFSNRSFDKERCDKPAGTFSQSPKSSKKGDA